MATLVRCRRPTTPLAGPSAVHPQATRPVLERVPTPLLICDVDGTVRRATERPVADPGDVSVFQHARMRINEWRNDIGGRVVLVSNQGGVALGTDNPERVVAAMELTVGELGGESAVDGWSLCPHHPSKVECWCRLPRPGLVLSLVSHLESAHTDETFPPSMAVMVGDSSEAEECAVSLAVAFVDAAAWRDLGVTPVGARSPATDTMRSYVGSISEG